jgi:Xaa-Pro aminopeptidase
VGDDGRTEEVAVSSPEPSTRRAPHDLPLGGWLTGSLAQGWEAEPPVPHPAVDGAAEAAARHRAALGARFPGESLVVPAGASPVRANDTHYAFRASSEYVYLTADQAEGAVLVLAAEPGRPEHRATLYLPERAGPGTPDYVTDRRTGAVWVGGVPDAAGTAERLELTVRPTVELPDALRALPGPVRVRRGVDAGVDRLLPAAEPDRAGLAEVIGELRAVKDAWEVDRLAEACAATARGFADVAAELPGLLARGGRRGERWLEGTFWRRARFEGNDVGYSSIVAAGSNGTSLHWAPVDGDLVEGQLLLADMGVETTSLYTADITRTLPVSGAWTPVQRRVYDAVHEANRAGIAEVRAGQPFLAAHQAAQWVLADHLRHWGVIGYKPDDALHADPERPGAGAHRRYTLHATSHMLGLDVHDCASLTPERYLGTELREGHCLTVEPGLYFQVNDLTVPAELRGLAVRIEDDVLVGSAGPVVLSDALPTDADELTGWMRDVRAS